jgi:hypothetical protein
MTGLHAAVRERDWDLVALYLLLGVARAAARLPEGSAADLISLLEAGGRRDER